ncbi:MAG TPA: S-adenosylmethionine:tRNA ribosyltransferase-isomerase [Casimicrobiaceae bacterium]|nr:S-adenosylmethionine:tRNA ribosyltransferase-isomerase [Casimicrobiaceae bacterium]
MIAAATSRGPGVDARLLVLTASAELRHASRASLVEFLRPGDLVVANDAMTLPASLHGVHVATGAPIELRLAGLQTPAGGDLRRSIAVVFGAGDFRMRTEDRPAPPQLCAGDRLAFGSLRARVVRTIGHPRLVAVAFDGSAEAMWQGLARHGSPIQYAHVPVPLALWDVWTAVAAVPVAFEPPSAGFVIDWALLAALPRRGIGFATLTHAAGISSTGDGELDRRLPLDEAYRIPNVTARAIANTCRVGGRIVAIGTTVVRALEHAARHGGCACRGSVVRAGNGVASQRIGPTTALRIVDVIVTGVHEAASSHYELLRAFADDRALRRAGDALASHGYRGHEFGDSLLVERSRTRRCEAPVADTRFAA